MTNEQILTHFMQEHYTTERLCWLLEHARSGKLSVLSCCCFVGITTSNHPLRGSMKRSQYTPEDCAHLNKAREADFVGAEAAFYHLGGGADLGSDEARREKLIPLIETELARRESITATQITQGEMVHAG